jgi:hypothetical protein
VGKSLIDYTGLSAMFKSMLLSSQVINESPLRYLLSACHAWRVGKYCNLVLVEFLTAAAPVYNKDVLMNAAMLWGFNFFSSSRGFQR